MTDGGVRVDRAHGGPVGDATTPELFGRVINDFSDLVDRQIELAKQEVRDEIGEAIGAARTLAIGAGVAAAAGFLLVIWAWTALISFLNFVGWEWLRLGWIGWLFGFLAPLPIGFFAWSGFIKRGIAQVKIKPLERTRATLQEDLEWLRQLRTLSGR
jgi:Putative Actinobacterial Holin-X, holin superfamily III